MTRILAVVLVAMLTMTTDSFAEKPDGKERPAPGAGGPRAGQQARNPEQMVARMMETFDKDGDQKLDVAELTALLTSLRERRARAGQEGAQRRRPGAEGQGNAAGRRGKPGGEQGKAGGERPKRPADEKNE